MMPGTAARSPAATPVGTMYCDTVFHSSRRQIAPAMPKPQPPVRNANGYVTSIGWMGWLLIEARLFMRAVGAKSPPEGGHYVAIPDSSRSVRVGVSGSGCEARSARLVVSGFSRTLPAPYVSAPTRSRMALSVAVARFNGRLLM